MTSLGCWLRETLTDKDPPLVVSVCHGNSRASKRHAIKQLTLSKCFSFFRNFSSCRTSVVNYGCLHRFIVPLVAAQRYDTMAIEPLEVSAWQPSDRKPNDLELFAISASLFCFLKLNALYRPVACEFSVERRTWSPERQAVAWTFFFWETPVCSLRSFPSGEIVKWGNWSVKRKNLIDPFISNVI